MCWLFSSGRPRLLKQFDIRRYLNLNSDLFSLHHGFSISDHQHINFNIDYQQLLSDKASPTDLIWFSLITGTRRELICFNLCVFKCLLKWSVWDDEHWLHLFYFSAPCLIKYYQILSNATQARAAAEIVKLRVRLPDERPALAAQEHQDQLYHWHCCWQSTVMTKTKTNNFWLLTKTS